MYIEILDTFLIPSEEKKFSDNDVIFQDDNASCHRAKSMKAFLQESHINSIAWSPNSPYLNPIENVCWKWKRLVHDKAPSGKVDLSTAFRQSWNQLDEECYFSLVKNSGHHKSKRRSNKVLTVCFGR